MMSFQFKLLILGFFSLLFSGCIMVGNEVIWLGKRTGGGSSCSWHYQHHVESTQKTPHGWIAMYRSEKFCSATIDRPSGQVWSVVGFSDQKLEDGSGKTNQEKACESCALLIKSDSEIKNFKIETSAPFYMNVSADIDNQRHSGTYAYYVDNQTGVTRTAKCGQVPEGQSQNFGNCIDFGSWERVVPELGNPILFDEQALQWVVDHPFDPNALSSALQYFAQTWSKASGLRTRETVVSLLTLIHDTGCAGPLAASKWGWNAYLDQLDVILTSEGKARTLESCIGPLDARQREELSQTKTPFITPKALETIDDETSRRAKAGKKFGTQRFGLWFERLDKSPAPSNDLVAMVDDRYVEESNHLDPYDSKRMTKVRLENSTPISRSSLVAFARLFNDYDIGVLIFSRPEATTYRDEIDQAWIDALAGAAVSGEVRGAFARRLTSLKEFPLSTDNFEKLHGVFLANPDALADVMITMLSNADGAQQKAMLIRLDAHAAESFPLGSQFFLERLSAAALPRPKPTTSEAILDKARSMKASGATFDDAACNVVRVLSLLPIERSCSLPDTL